MLDGTSRWPGRCRSLSVWLLSMLVLLTGRVSAIKPRIGDDATHIVLDKRQSTSDVLDVISCVMYVYVQAYNTLSGLRMHQRAQQQACPLSKRAVLIINTAQSALSALTVVLLLVRHCLPTWMSCEVSMGLGSMTLAVTNACITVILLALACQWSAVARHSRWLLGVGGTATVASAVVTALIYVAMHVEETPWRKCSLAGVRLEWVLGKLAMDLAVGLALSSIYLLMLFRVVRDTGLPIYRAMFTHGLLGRFAVILSNIACAILVASQVAPSWTLAIYFADALIASSIINCQMQERHEAFIEPLLVGDQLKQLPLHHHHHSHTSGHVRIPSDDRGPIPHTGSYIYTTSFTAFQSFQDHGRETIADTEQKCNSSIEW